MGSLFKKPYRRPIPEGAKLETRKGIRVAVWNDRGRKRVAPVEGNRIVLERGFWIARYVDGTGVLRERSTRCKDRQAAQSLLTEWERTAELVRAKVFSADDAEVSQYAEIPLDQHIDAYQKHLQAKGTTTQYSKRQAGYLQSIFSACGFQYLSDLSCERAESQLTKKRKSDKTGARTHNKVRAALVSFGNWCIENGRLSRNPFLRLPKLNEATDRRHIRRPFTAAEVSMICNAALRRPVAEYGRETKKIHPKRGEKKRSNWVYKPLTKETLEQAYERGLERLQDSPHKIQELLLEGRNRSLTYRMLFGTGLRLSEAASIRVCDARLDSTAPHLVLHAKNEKNRKGSSIPLPHWLAEELRQWLVYRQEELRDGIISINEDAPKNLPDDEPLLWINANLSKRLNADMQVAGVEKNNGNGLLDVHSFRSGFCTQLAISGVSLTVAQALMRHSDPRLTAGVYTKLNLNDVAGAVQTIPEITASDQIAKSDEKMAETA